MFTFPDSQGDPHSANQFGVISHQHSQQRRYYIGQILCIHHSNWSCQNQPLFNTYYDEHMVQNEAAVSINTLIDKRSRLEHRKNSGNHNFGKMKGRARMKSYQLIGIRTTLPPPTLCTRPPFRDNSPPSKKIFPTRPLVKCGRLT